METELFTSNYKPPPPLKERLLEYKTKAVEKIKIMLKNPKIITIFTLVLILLVVFISLMLISSRKNRYIPLQNKPLSVVYEKTSPTPVATNPTVSQLNGFYQDLDDSLTFLDKLKKPIVELDLGLNK